MIATEKLMKNFQHCGVKDLRYVDGGDVEIDSVDFTTDKKHFLDCLYHTASLLGVTGPKPEQVGKITWREAKCVLDKVLSSFGAYVLIPICRTDGCAGFMEKKNAKCGAHAAHSKKVMRKPCDCDNYKQKGSCKCQHRSSLYRIARTTEGEKIAAAYLGNKKSIPDLIPHCQHDYFGCFHMEFC